MVEKHLQNVFSSINTKSATFHDNNGQNIKLRTN